MSISSGTLVKNVFVLIGGAVAGYFASLRFQSTPPLPNCAPCVECAPDHVALSAATSKIAELQSSLHQCLGRELTSPNQESAPRAQSSGQSDVLEEPADVDDRAPTPGPSAWRISAIEKFVPLTEEQRERLKAKFALKNDDPQAETLDQILGVENARYYRDQVQSAFRRMEQQELDKEIVWVSRQLNLTDAQELSVRETFQGIEDTLSQDVSGIVVRGGTPQERVQRMVAENKKRQSLRAEQLKAVLSAEQYQAYLKNQAESTESDMEVFHDPTAH